MTAQERVRKGMADLAQQERDLKYLASRSVSPMTYEVFRDLEKVIGNLRETGASLLMEIQREEGKKNA